MKIFKIIIGIILAIIVLFVLILLFFIITEYRPDDVTIIEPSPYSPEVSTETPGGLSIMSWNIGYCGLDGKMDFFLEGGTGPSRAPLERQRDALDSIIETIDLQEPDVCFLQEVDIKSRRSYKVDELYAVSSGLRDYQVNFALNYKNPFIPLPLSSPIGGVKSGIAVFSRYKTSSTERLQLPGQYDWPVRMFFLKRCAIVSRIPSPEAGRDWILINIHLTAYGDGNQRSQQLAYLKELITDFYDEGHYVVVGGDWNSLFPGMDKNHFGAYSTLEEHLGWVQLIPEEWTPDNWQWCYDAEVPTSRSLEKPYKKGENFTCIIDGFLVSPNLRVDEVRGYDLRFEHSDHNPVSITVSIRD